MTDWMDDMPPPPDPDPVEPDPAETAEELLRERLLEGGRKTLNDYGNGQRVVLYHGEDLLHVTRLGWHVWDGHVWEEDFDKIAVRRRAHQIGDLVKREAFALRMPDLEAAIVAQAEETAAQLLALTAKAKAGLSEDEAAEMARLRQLEKSAKEILAKATKRRAGHLSHAKSAGNTAAIGNMLVEAIPYLSRPAKSLNCDPLAINTESQTLQLVQVDVGGEREAWEYAVEARLQSREDLITKRMPVIYDPTAEAPVFMRFLERIQPEPEMRAFLQRWFGYSLTGLTSEQKLVFLHGGGRNGKSTLVDLVAKLMGEYATSMPIETLTGSDTRKGSEATPDLVRLPGARMVRASEPEKGVQFKEALIKLLTGGEPILIRKMREEFVEVDPVFKLTISGNSKPEVRGTDDGIWRRLLLVPFDVQVPKEEVDLLLPAKLWAERSGVLNWLIDGALDYLNGGLREPEHVMTATEEFREDSDPIRTFLVDACRVTGLPEDFELARDLVEAFQLWQRDQGGASWGNRTVQNRLAEKAEVFRIDGQVYSRRRSAQSTGYSGIRLTDDMERRLREVRAEGGDRRRPKGEGRSGGPDAGDLM
ncbi:hypothetical protein CNY89_08865 [Amaricoccus sp. HAR-UPW-R2A-40]|nr:hypothetical protein CNY89_08865 [Amaricoccus sp. HAR-UPW-R2A-40]